jgi:hypothetical protein
MNYTSATAIFWALTFTLTGVVTMAIVLGGHELVRVVVVAVGVYSVIGLAYGRWAALHATRRAGR